MVHIALFGILSLHVKRWTNSQLGAGIVLQYYYVQLCRQQIGDIHGSNTQVASGQSHCWVLLRKWAAAVCVCVRVRACATVGTDVLALSFSLHEHQRCCGRIASGDVTSWSGTDSWSQMCVRVRSCMCGCLVVWFIRHRKKKKKMLPFIQQIKFMLVKRSQRTTLVCKREVIKNILSCLS